MRRLPGPLSAPLIRNRLVVDRNNADGVVFKIADTRDELEAAYRLVHEVYVSEGYTDPHRSGLRVNLRYALPTTATIVGLCEGSVVITLTVIGDSPLGLPMDMIFSEELYAFRKRGRYLVEIGALASHPDYRKRQQALALYADKASLLYAMRHLGADDAVIAVNPRHEWVYKYLMLFETISTVKGYQYVNGAPAVAMRLELGSSVDRWAKAYASRPSDRNFHDFFVTADPERIQLPEAKEPYDIWDEGLFRYFFEHKTDPRRDGHGSLLDLYRFMYGRPEAGPVVRAQSTPILEEYTRKDGTAGVGSSG
jgi:hypothetical protein